MFLLFYFGGSAMKKFTLITVVIAVSALFFAACDFSNDAKDTRVVLTAGPAVPVPASSTSAAVSFSGASGLTLAKSDFTVSGGTIDSVSVSGNNASVIIIIPENTGSDPVIYLVGIAADSTIIRGKTKVTVTQAGVSAPITIVNALKLGALQGSGGDGDNVRWVFNASGTIPMNSATFSGSKYLVIASVGGGKIANSTTLDPTTEGFEPIEIEFAGQGTDWGNGWATTRIKPQAVNYIVPFTHSATETVYFVYDLSAFSGFSAFSDLGDNGLFNAANIEVRFVWDVAVLALGQYKAYLTTVNLSSTGADTLMKMDNGEANQYWIPDGTTFGWITTNPVGLVLPE